MCTFLPDVMYVCAVFPPSLPALLDLTNTFGISVLVQTESEYSDMVKDKTGGLFRMCFRLMQAFSASRKDFTEMIDLLSLYFQIRDDYVNLTRYRANET